MASCRAVHQFLRQKRVLYCLQSTSLCSFKTSSISQASYSNQGQNIPTKSRQSDSENQVQVGFAEVGKNVFFLLCISKTFCHF